MRRGVFAFFLFSSAFVSAQTVPGPDAPDGKGRFPAPPDPRVIQLEITLNQLNQAQQSVYQQFQMVQELRRNETQSAAGGAQHLSSSRGLYHGRYEQQSTVKL
jgi:hypothetical protein